MQVKNYKCYILYKNQFSLRNVQHKIQYIQLQYKLIFTNKIKINKYLKSFFSERSAYKVNNRQYSKSFLGKRPTLSIFFKLFFLPIIRLFLVSLQQVKHLLLVNLSLQKMRDFQKNRLFHHNQC